MRGQGDQHSGGWGGGQPVAGQFGGGQGEKAKHHQQPAGGKWAQGGPGGLAPPAGQGLGQPQQQQGRERQAGYHQHRPKKPPGLQVVIHHRGEALQVVISKEALPEGLPLHQQLGAIPGQGHGGGDHQARQRPPQPHQQPWLSLPPGEQGQGQAHQHQGHGPLREHRQPQQQPTGPPALAFRVGIAAPEEQQAQGQGGGEQAIAHRHPAPDQHQGREGKGQGCAEGRQGRPGGAAQAAIGGRRWGLGPAQQGGRQGQHHHHAGEGRGQAGCPGAQGIPERLAGQQVAQPHQPVDERRFVVAGQAIDPGGEPVAGLGHGPGRGGKQGRRFIHQARAAQPPEEEGDAAGQHQQQHSAPHLG